MGLVMPGHPGLDQSGFPCFRLTLRTSSQRAMRPSHRHLLFAQWSSTILHFVARREDGFDPGQPWPICHSRSCQLPRRDLHRSALFPVRLIARNVVRDSTSTQEVANETTASHPTAGLCPRGTPPPRAMLPFRRSPFASSWGVGAPERSRDDYEAPLVAVALDRAGSPRFLPAYASTVRLDTGCYQRPR
jgi:hypothetical protein